MKILIVKLSIILVYQFIIYGPLKFSKCIKTFNLNDCYKFNLIELNNYFLITFYAISYICIHFGNLVIHSTKKYLFILG